MATRWGVLGGEQDLPPTLASIPALAGCERITWAGVLFDGDYAENTGDGGVRDAHFTRQERFLINWLRFLTIAFFGAMLILACLPHLFLTYVNDIGRVFFHVYSPPLLVQDWDLWRLLSVIFLLMLTYTASQVQRDWLRFYSFVPLLILAKGCSLLGFLGLIFLTPGHFFYIVGAAVDGLLFVLTWYYYARAITSRPAVTPHTF